MPETAKDEFLYSPAVSQAAAASFGVGSNLTWDAFVRQSYGNVNAVIQQQANDLLRRGNVREAEARALVEGQRNALVRAMRERLSPFGRLYSEISKPSPSLPTLERLVREKGSIQAVLTSVGKSRAVVNRSLPSPVLLVQARSSFSSRFPPLLSRRHRLRIEPEWLRGKPVESRVLLLAGGAARGQVARDLRPSPRQAWYCPSWGK